MGDDKKVVSLKGARGKKQGKPEEVQSNKDSSQKEYVVCSFCQRPSYQVPKMVQGPDVNICSECAMIAVQYLILEDKIPSEEARKILDLFWHKAK